MSDPRLLMEEAFLQSLAAQIGAAMQSLGEYPRIYERSLPGQLELFEAMDRFVGEEIENRLQTIAQAKRRGV